MYTHAIDYTCVNPGKEGGSFFPTGGLLLCIQFSSYLAAQAAGDVPQFFIRLDTSYIPS
jgi:hypothetical protein